MFGLVFGEAGGAAERRLDAIGRSQAIIEFELDGTVVTANRKFLDTLGYALEEIRGRNHSMFVEPGYAASDDYRRFWEDLRAGVFRADQFRRIGKGGREVWIEASYNPVLDRNGRPVRVIKVATDVSARKAEHADLAGQIAALQKSQAVIAFAMDGTVLSANQKFLDALGYSLEEIQGRKHSMFVEPAYAASEEYERFWAELRAGKYQAAQFRRVGKGGRAVWIEASYNPILDPNGVPVKVVKFATDVTAQVALLADLKRIVDENFGEIDAALATSNERAERASVAMRSTSDSVQMMAASTEELAASVREIADSMGKSRTAVDVTRGQLAQADTAIQKLAAMSQSMVGVVGLIRDIAGRINLLALNATIESARAGDAGKGFAVVASEVKNLARQAGGATDQIAGEIDSLQSVSSEVVAALGLIERSIGSVLEYVTVTAGAVEEQSAVTRDMSASMQRTASSSNAVNDNMNEITVAVRRVEEVVAGTRDAARVLVR